MTTPTTAHAALINDILLEFGSLDTMRLWRANAGAARTKTGALVRFGVKGQADISGILAGTGRRIEIEVKTGGAKQSKQQKRWQAMVEKFGGLFVLARSIDDVREVLG